MSKGLTGLLLSAFAVVLLMPSNLNAAAADWLQDFAMAKAQAASEKKDLLIDFTGSDWCGWCIKLDGEVFDKQEFLKEAKTLFVLVKLDFPRKKKLPNEIAAQNKELQEKYKVTGFPSILLTDDTGKAYGKTGYQEGGPEKYLAHLREIKDTKIKSDALFVQAGKAAGSEKAKLLDEAVSALVKNGIEDGLEAWINEIQELDKDNQGGLKRKWENRGRLTEISQEMGKTNNVDKALKDLDDFLKNNQPSAEMQQQALVEQAKIYMGRKRDQANGLVKLKEAIKADPESKLAKQLAEYVQKMEGQKASGAGVRP